MDYKGKTALITGASGGIGEEFARALAKRGTNLVLVARSEEKLRRLAVELAPAHGITVEVIAADLADADAVRALPETVRERGARIDMLVNNAGFGTHGAFIGNDAAREHDEVMLNVAAVVDLTHAFLPAMVERGDGAIVNVASVAGFQPLPYMAVYGATKAFVLSFSQALWGEYRAKGVRVLALCPGATKTDFFDAVGTSDAQVGPMMSVQSVVATAMKALEKDTGYVVAGWANTALAQSGRLMPLSAITRVAERLMRPRPPKKQRTK